jgi:ABC-type amino acid transport substrate-binding protein
VDAYIGNQVVASYLIKKFTLPNLKLVSLWRTDLPGQLRFAVHKDRPVLRDILQKGLDAITKDEQEAILSTYIDVSGFKQKVFSLTQEQWDWLKAHPKLALGVARH